MCTLLPHGIAQRQLDHVCTNTVHKWAPETILQALLPALRTICNALQSHRLRMMVHRSARAELHAEPLGARQMLRTALQGEADSALDIMWRKDQQEGNKQQAAA